VPANPHQVEEGLSGGGVLAVLKGGGWGGGGETGSRAEIHVVGKLRQGCDVASDQVVARRAIHGIPRDRCTASCRSADRGDAQAVQRGGIGGKSQRSPHRRGDLRGRERWL